MGIDLRAVEEVGPNHVVPTDNNTCCPHITPQKLNPEIFNKNDLFNWLPSGPIKAQLPLQKISKPSKAETLTEFVNSNLTTHQSPPSSFNNCVVDALIGELDHKEKPKSCMQLKNSLPKVSATSPLKEILS